MPHGCIYCANDPEVSISLGEERERLRGSLNQPEVWDMKEEVTKYRVFEIRSKLIGP